MKVFQRMVRGQVMFYGWDSQGRYVKSRIREVVEMALRGEFE